MTGDVDYECRDLAAIYNAHVNSAFSVCRMRSNVLGSRADMKRLCHVCVCTRFFCNHMHLVVVVILSRHASDEASCQPGAK